MRTFRVLWHVRRITVDPALKVARGAVAQHHRLREFCIKHASLLKKLHHYGDIGLLASVSLGIHEMEVAASGCLLLVVLVLGFVSSNEA